MQNLSRHRYSHSDLLHGTVHNSNKFQSNSWNPYRVRAVILALRPCGKFKISMECAKIVQAWLFLKVMCFMVLCIIPSNFRLRAKILNKLSYRGDVIPQTWSKPAIENFCEMCKNWLSLAILNINLLHVIVHHSTKSQADNDKPQIFGQ